MNSIISYKRNSYSLSKKEKEILLLLLDFFKYDIPNGNGSFILMLDLDNINFLWSPKMALDDEGVFGAWSIMHKNTVYLRPYEYSEAFYNKITSEDFILVKNEKENVECIKAKIGKLNTKNIFSDLNLDQELLNFIFNMCECQGQMLSTVFHELYHKFQFNSSKIGYFFNKLLFSLIGYDYSTKIKASIEGDVRENVDTDELHNAIENFYGIFYSYVYNLKKIANYEKQNVNDLSEDEKQDYKNSVEFFNELNNDYSIKSEVTFCKTLLDLIKK